MLQLSHPDLVAMLNAVRAAGVVTRSVQADLVSAGTLVKDDRSPVTVADFASQAVISQYLVAMAEECPLVAEESADELRQDENGEVLAAVVERAKTQWDGATEETVLAAIDRGQAPCDGTGKYFTLDPIDGTKGFLRGEHYAIALAKIEDGVVTAAALGCPNLRGPAGQRGVVFVGAKNGGVLQMSLTEEIDATSPVRVSPNSDPAKIRFCQSVVKAHSHKGRAAEVAELLGVTAEPVAMDSQCKYALVARGDAELYLRIPRDDVYVEKIWDHAAGSLIVTESGGTVSDVNGKPLDFSIGRLLEKNRGVVASNGPNHGAVIEALQQTA
jgi:3'(2'), 5'-bisphosphate nucleotidase